MARSELAQQGFPFAEGPLIAVRIEEEDSKRDD